MNMMTSLENYFRAQSKFGQPVDRPSEKHHPTFRRQGRDQDPNCSQHGNDNQRYVDFSRESIAQEHYNSAAEYEEHNGHVVKKIIDDQCWHSVSEGNALAQESYLCCLAKQWTGERQKADGFTAKSCCERLPKCDASMFRRNCGSHCDR